MNVSGSLQKRMMCNLWPHNAQRSHPTVQEADHDDDDDDDDDEMGAEAEDNDERKFRSLNSVMRKIWLRGGIRDGESRNMERLGIERLGMGKDWRWRE